MTHEFRDIVFQAHKNQCMGLKNVLASVVFLEGSSYRKPGVRMLIDENGVMTGAVSGGCVEKEIVRRSQSVFRNKKAKVITYDGRYRLGCEGILYILIEPFVVSDVFLEAFRLQLKNRTSFTITSYFQKKDDVVGHYGSIVCFENSKKFPFSEVVSAENDCFVQVLQPCFRLIIIGGEHDAVKLCEMASFLGWEVNVITSIKETKQISDFEGATTVVGDSPETIQFTNINDNTAVVLMNHSYVQDLHYLVKLIGHKPQYLGILGAAKRRERLFNELFELAPEVTDAFLETIYTPAGLNIGAETPEEIALSILAEIQSVVKEKEPFSLRKITGKINV